MEGAGSLSEDELIARGGNASAIHLDFMIGSSEVDIDGIATDGRRDAVMRAGEWAFPL